MEHTIGGIQVHEDGQPAGLPLVLIHGFPFDHTMWRPQIAALGSSHRILSYDVRGHGRSDAGDGQYSIEMFVDDLMLVLDRLNVARAAVCGLSMGGYIALRAVERHPERFSALILCDTKSEADGNEAKVKRAAAAKAVKADGAANFAEGFVKGVLAESTLKNRPEIAAAVTGMIRSNTPLGIAGTLLALAGRTDTTEALKQMNLPALILVGEEDKLTPPSASEAMQKLLPQSELHVIPGAAHLSNLENPAIFNQKLSAFLGRIRA